MNILETPITIFDSVTSTNGHVASLAEFLNDASSHQLIQQIRMTEDKTERTRLKSGLPCATISAFCTGGRKADDAFEHTGLICIDIDGQDNPGFGSGAELKAEVCKVAEVSYCSLSASGNGCFAIFRLSHPENHLGHFLALQRLFKSRLSIVIDGQCKDVKRLRFASYDSEPYINGNAEPFRIIDAATKSKPNPTKTTVAMEQRTWNENPEATIDKVARLTEEVMRRGIDLTDGYSNWVEIGMALANLGEAGREFFHAVSSVYPGYDRAKVDTKFTNLLRTTRKVTIATFFHQCEGHGVTLDRNH
ncbi:BT4734/BF3469 family protein [uncultured Bacteroides sp.]|uniref:BT4734/BF3469 family protein n=1 Tax=uncultured Bacteroides sp. TaxID=162156 RepID=UPI00263611AF|nr:BT4734/BF3469 family protein [uncultured Bacteroides sp.]